MTLEEKAHKYTIKNVCNNCNQCQSKGYIGCDTFRFAKKTYIDSVEENGMVCHDLKKDPNDLPKDYEYIICILEDGHKLECFYDPTTKTWFDSFFHHDIEYGYYQSKVIAWCEEPQFKE